VGVARVSRRAGLRPDLADTIVDAALALAEEGGFEHVRQRDVASRAGVALRTLYKAFPTKEELLAVGLVRAADEVDRRLARRPALDRTAAKRLTRLFDEMSAVLCERPKLAKAIVRAATSGVPGAAGALRAHTTRGVALVIATRRGRSATETAPSADDVDVAMILLRVWFASLIAWCAHTDRDASFLTEAMAPAIRLLAE
jgi:AcrR family transcriptional regulator